MPSWRAMARREIPAGPPSASCARAAVLMSAIVSCRRRSRRLGRTWGEDRLTTRAACRHILAVSSFCSLATSLSCQQTWLIWKDLGRARAASRRSAHAGAAGAGHRRSVRDQPVDHRSGHGDHARPPPLRPSGAHPPLVPAGLPTPRMRLPGSPRAGFSFAFGYPRTGRDRDSTSSSRWRHCADNRCFFGHRS